MAGRPNLWNRPPVAGEAEERTFTDPLHPDLPVTLVLRPKDGVNGTRALSLYSEKMQRYVWGEIGADGKKKQPAVLIGGDQQKYAMTDADCQVYADLQAFWAGPDLECPADLEIKSWQTRMPTAWFEIMAFIREMRARTEPEATEAGASAADPTADSSPESYAVIENIPRSQPAETLSSAASNGASGHWSEPLAAKIAASTRQPSEMTG